ncbi:MAG TPA: response regulator, partial [Coleofasciculaceae cyanobacterium]
VVIKEIKQAQELVVASRSVEICVSEALEALVPASFIHEVADAQQPEHALTFESDFEPEYLEFEMAQGNGNGIQNETAPSVIELFGSSDSDLEVATPEESYWENFHKEVNEEDIALDLGEITFPDVLSEETTASTASQFSISSDSVSSKDSVQRPLGANLIEPEVGMAELNTLADIFEGQTPDLDQTWQEEEILNLDDKFSASDSGELFDWDEQSDFSDLVGDLDGYDLDSEDAGTSASRNNDLMDLFGDDFTGEGASHSPAATHSINLFEADTPQTDRDADGFSDLLFESDSSDSLLTSSPSSDELSSLFGESFFEEDDSVEQNPEGFEFELDAPEQVQQQDDSILSLPLEEVFDEELLEFSSHTDTVGDAKEEHDFLSFEDASPQVPDRATDEHWLDESDAVSFEQAALAESEIDFNDLLEISEGDHTVDEISDDLRLGEEFTIDSETTDVSFDAFTFDEDEASPGFDFGANEAWTETGVEDSTDAALFFDESVQAVDEPDLVFEDMGLADIDPSTEVSELDFDLDATSSSPFNSETTRSQNIEDLFGEEAFLSSEEPQPAAVEALEGFDDLFDASSPHESQVPTLEELDFSAFEEAETMPDLEALSALIDLGEGTQSISDRTSADVVPETPAALEDSAIEFEDFSLFEMPAATDDFEDTGVASSQASDVQEDGFEEPLFEPSATDGEFFADFSDGFLDTDENELFDLETTEPQALASQAASENTADIPPSVSNLEALFGDETPEETETDTLDFSSFDLGELNFDEDFSASDASLSELEFDAETEAAEEGQVSMFEWDEAESIDLAALEEQTPANVEASTLEAGDESTTNLSVSDLEAALFGDETLGESDRARVATPEVHALDDFEDNLFDLEIPAESEQELPDEESADAFLDWEGMDTVEADNLEDLLNLESESDALNADILAAQIDSSFTTTSSANSLLSEFADLESLLADSAALSTPHPSEMALDTSEFNLSDEFADLDSLLAEESLTQHSLAVPSAPTAPESEDFDVFKDLDALLEEQSTAAPPSPARSDTDTKDNAFGDLESLLEDAEKSMGGPPTIRSDQSSVRPLIRPRTRIIEQTMRVPVKQLDSLSNLVGELVVNRNTLEQDQERLRQFLDNLSHQVLALSDVGSRMQDLYERSLLESSLLASRQGYRSSHSDRPSQQHSSDVEYDPLEMDRFTGFHLLSQEMIELIVRVRESASDIEFLVDETDQVARMLRQVTTQLQEGLTRARMVPFAQNADRLLRAVHEISRKLGKEAKLVVEGRETLIDKMILEHLYDPMTHLVNNALTHGIEKPEVRKAARKQTVGQVVLRAFHQGNQTVISISDDGAGIDPERVRTKAIEQKLISREEAKNLTNVELYDFLFHPGFSTKDKADDFSGRGVGMDVVRTSLSEIRGNIHIESAVGKGTTFTIRLPLTLSICKALCCLSDRARIAFPMDGVEDMLDVPSDRVQVDSDGQNCIQWRETLLPFHPLCDLLTYNRHLSRGNVYGGKREDDAIAIVVLRSAGNFLAIQVDQVLGEQEIVIKQLEGPAPKPVGIAGATVLGDGRIMAIADVMELIDLSRGAIRKDGGVSIWSREEPQIEIPPEVPETKTEPLVLIVDDSITVRELLSMTFNKAGYRVEQARDGQEAWEKLRSGLPCDIVFCDIEMPRMDGLELLSRLQKDENLNHLPIAMLTSRGADRHRQMAAQLGASGYFTKPYLEEVLLDAAQRMIKGEVLFNSASNA